MRLHVIDAVLRVLSVVFVGGALASDIRVDLLWQNTTFNEVTAYSDVIMRVIAALAQSSLSALQLINMETGLLATDVAISLQIHDENAMIDDLLQLPQFIATGHSVQVTSASYMPLQRPIECFSITMKRNDSVEYDAWSKAKSLLLEYYGAHPMLVYSDDSTIGVCVHDDIVIYTDELTQHYDTDVVNLEIFLKSKWADVENVSIFSHKARKTQQILNSLVTHPYGEQIINCPVEFCFVLQWSIPEKIFVNTIDKLFDSTVISNVTAVINPGDEWLIYDPSDNGSVGFECVLDHFTAGPIVLAWEGALHFKDVHSILVPMVLPNGWSIEMATKLDLQCSVITITLHQDSSIVLEPIWSNGYDSDATLPLLFNEIKDLPVGSSADLTTMITLNDSASTIRLWYESLGRLLSNTSLVLITKQAQHIIPLVGTNNTIDISCQGNTITLTLFAENISASLAELNTTLAECLPQTSLRLNAEVDSIKINYPSFYFGPIPTFESSSSSITLHSATLDVTVV